MIIADVLLHFWILHLPLAALSAHAACGVALRAGVDVDGAGVLEVFLRINGTLLDVGC